MLKLTSSCVLCGDSTNEPISLCLSCQGDLPRLESSCEQCGLPTVESFQGKCGQCQRHSPDIDYTSSLFYYQPPIDYLIGQLKFEGSLTSASILGNLLARICHENGMSPDVILPVPLHNKRLLKRGFNQSLEIAKPVASHLGVAIDFNLARRIKATRAQAKLDLAQRNKNIKNCFEVDTANTYKHVLLIDDVITTGSTINELARVLKKSGVETVGVWSVARAILN